MKQTNILKLLATLFVVLLTNFFFTSCSDDDDDDSVSSATDPALVGTWLDFYQSGNYASEFYTTYNRNGTGYSKDREKYNGTWSEWNIEDFIWEVKNGCLIMKWDYEIEYLNYKIEKNTLYIKDVDENSWSEWVRSN
ncbi:MAG: hypothetical protein HDS49_01540 [Bacteroides sp.]|nr:hypothetical protein [Bacteroides sp.]